MYYVLAYFYNNHVRLKRWRNFANPPSPLSRNLEKLNQAEVKKYPPPRTFLMEVRGSLPRQQEATTCPYLQPEDFKVTIFREVMSCNLEVSEELPASILTDWRMISRWRQRFLVVTIYQTTWRQIIEGSGLNIHGSEILRAMDSFEICFFQRGYPHQYIR
jgi:hypothetical protein